MRHPYGTQPFLPEYYWRALGITRLIIVCMRYEAAERLKLKWGFR